MKLQDEAMIFALHIHSRQISLQEPNEALMFLRQRARRDACNAMSRQRPPPGYLSTVSWTHEGETTYKARFVTSLHKPAMFNLVHILTGMRRSGKTSSCSSSSLNTRKGGHLHMQTPTLSVLTAQPSTEGTLAHRCSRRPSGERGKPACDDLHGLEQRRAHATTRHGHTHRTESEARLVAALLNQSLVQGLMQVVGLPVSLIHSLECGDGLVQHLAGRILQLLLGVVSRLQVALGGEQRAHHAGDLAQQAHAR